MAAQTVIGSTIVIDGEVRSSEDISIQGTVKGRIETKADLFVEASGTIEAEVNTHSIEIHGTVVGNVRASDKYELMREGRVTGDIAAPRVVIADGAKFKGHIDMVETNAPPRLDEGIKPGGKPGKR
jgi:cytoskeletal protein CcmA (bactofilin family)